MKKVEKIMTLSLVHIMRKTDRHLVSIGGNTSNIDWPVIIPDQTGGWIIRVPEDFLYWDEDGFVREKFKGLPADLYACMQHAFEYDCQWLSLDVNGPEEESLPIYGRPSGEL